MKKKVLFVDDEANFTNMVKMNLDETGEYEVKVENNGKRALACAKQFKPDLIFLDVVMPDIDGPSIMNQIKEDKDLKDTPIVFLTALAIKNGASVVGGHKFLAKPVSIRQLIACIKENIQK